MPIKSRHKEELLRAYQEVYKWCEARGVKPQLHRMDNETSKDVEDFIVGQQKATLQYTAPDRHCHPTEKAVQTFKATFKYILAFLPKIFPLHIGAACYRRRTSASTLYTPIGRILCCRRGRQWRANCTLMSPTVGPDIPRVTFSSARNQYFSEQVCDEVFP